MNIIFLDIDGVLNSKFWDENHQMEISDGKYIDTEKVSLLSKVVNSTKASIVLHSGWRFWFDEKLKPTRKEAEHLVSLLEKEGLSISGVTPDLTTEEIRKTKKFSKVKADEILTWLREHEDTENWVVLDDLDLHNEAIARHQVMTDSEYGLTEDDATKAIKMLTMEHQGYNLEKLLDKFVSTSKDILKDNLAGIYLHGSAVMGCFNPEKSDVDLIVVVNEKMDEAAKRAFMDMVVALNEKGPAKGIEMSVVTKDVCKPFVYPTPFDLHFSAMHLGWYKDNPDDYVQKMNGTDKDLAAHFTIIGKRGKCLYGQPVKDVFGEVPSKSYMDSIRDDICDAPEDIAENTMYLVLNLARVLAYRKDGSVLSKKEGGEWALNNVPDEYHSVISAALREYASGKDLSYNIDLAKEYAKYMIEQISNKER